MLERKPVPLPGERAGPVQAQHDGPGVHDAQLTVDLLGEADLLALRLPLEQPGPEPAVGQSTALADGAVADVRPQAQQVWRRRRTGRREPADADRFLPRAGEHRLLPRPGRLALLQELDEVERVLGTRPGSSVNSPLSIRSLSAS